MLYGRTEPRRGRERQRLAVKASFQIGAKMGGDAGLTAKLALAVESWLSESRVVLGGEAWLILGDMPQGFGVWSWR
ncbi:MAG: hypothetical protein ABJ370_16380 [Paracoccaceae bacterium]